MGGSWYHASMSTVQRSRGHAPMTAKAAYRAAERIEDGRTGEAFDYRARSGVLDGGIELPEAAPEWMRDRAVLWNAAEAAERRKDSQVGRELDFSLPNDAPREEWRRVIDEVTGYIVQRHGAAVQWDLHAPHREGDERNTHVHLLISSRRVGPEGFTGKMPELDDKRLSGKSIEDIRHVVANAINRSLERVGSSERVDHRSFERRGLDREAERHLGPSANAMERRGEGSDRGDHNRAVQARNAEREALKAQARVIDLAAKIEERKAELERQRTELARKAEEERRKTEADRQRPTQREKQRFKAWANAQRAEQRSRQFDRSGELGNRHAWERMNLDDRLEVSYGPGKRVAREKLQQIGERQERGGILYRLTGRARRDREEAEGLRATLKDIAQREEEEKGALERAQEADRAAQEARHRRGGPGTRGRPPEGLRAPAEGRLAALAR